MRYKTGLLHGPAPQLRFRAFTVPSKLPPLPPTFGHYTSVGRWGMLMNDVIGDCTVAGAMHAVMLWCAVSKRSVHFTSTDAEEDYSAITGYIPGNDASDTGANIIDVADYWRKTGFRDAINTRHKILAYLHVDHRNFNNLDMACYLFGAVGLGVQIRQSDEDAFSRGQPWIPQHDPVQGYHYVPYVGKNAQFRKVVTWGGLQNVTEPWLVANCNEAVAMIGVDALVNNQSVEGFNLAALQSDLNAIGEAA